MNTLPLPPIPQPTNEISLRDHFAGLVLNGIIASDDNTCIRASDPKINGHAYLAKTSYQIADAMLAARQQAK